MLKALRDEIIVRPIYVKSAGVIILPDVSPEYKKYHGSIYGEVISVGPRYKYNLKPGDKVTFRRHEGKRIVYEGIEYLALKDKWVDSRLEG